MFQHVVLTWIIQSNQKLNFDSHHHCYSWIINGPWYNTTICSRLHGFSFEYYYITGIQDRHNLMCSIEAHGRYHPTVNNDSISFVVIPLPYNSTKCSLVLFGIPLNFVDSWLK